MRRLIVAALLLIGSWGCIPSDVSIEDMWGDLVTEFRYFESFYSRSPVHLTGDSIIHLGEYYFEMEGWYVSGIAGEEAWHLKTRLLTVVNTKPDFVVIHIGANDIIAGRSIEQVFEEIKDIVLLLRKLLPPETRIGWLEINPLGDPLDNPLIPDSVARELLSEQANINYKNYLLNRAIESWDGVEFIPTRHYLVDQDGYIRPEYGLGDLKHVNEKAYIEVYIPVIRAWLKGERLQSSALSF